MDDLVLATFGRGFWVLDDYSALRGVTPQTTSAEAELLPLRDAYNTTSKATSPAVWGNETTPNPRLWGGVHVPGERQVLRQSGAPDQRRRGKQIRLIDLPQDAGVHRVAWNFSCDAAPGQGGGGRGGRGGGRGAPAGPPPTCGEDGAAEAAIAAIEQTGRGGGGGAGGRQGGGFGRGRGSFGPPADAGRYSATLARLEGGKVTAIGTAREFVVRELK